MSGAISTASPSGAREHARAQAGTVVDAMPIVPASAAEEWPAEAEGARRLHAETVAGGGYTSLRVAAGARIELVDIAGDAAVNLVLHSAAQRDERLNVADTVKIQWQAYLEEGAMLLSDRGRVLASVLTDSSGVHDLITGSSSAARNTARYGDGTIYGPTPAGTELLRIAGAKHGLEPRDIPPSATLFAGVRVAEDGSMTYAHGAAGARVVLRAEQDLIVLIADAPHPLDPRAEYVCSPVRVRAWSGEPAGLDDPLATATPEARRAFANTIQWNTSKERS